MSLAIEISGVRYLDYTSASYTWSLEAAARSFTFDFSDKWLLTETTELPFREGDPCKIYAEGEQVLDGFIDNVAISYDDKSHSISVSGRSWTGHLVDCSAIHKTGKWRKATLSTIAGDVADPFGVSVTLDPSVPPIANSEVFARWAIQEEETAMGLIARAAKLRGVFPTSTEKREVLITGAGTAKSSGRIEYGNNVKRCTRQGRWSERYSNYAVKSQTAGNDDYFAEDAANKGVFTVDDPDVSSYRPLILVADGQGFRSELEARANWERNVRAGRSQRLQYAVADLKTENGDLWQANTLTRVIDPLVDVDAELLIISVTYSHTLTEGLITNLTIGSPAGLDVYAPPPRRKRRKYL